jgi:alcohol dehydrogenase
MRTLMFEGPGELHWREVPDARIQDDRDAVVRPLAVARCDLDPAIASGLYPMPFPFALGHEMAGEIVALGDAITNHSIGDRVIVPFQISCGACAMCDRGYSNACEAVPSGSAFGLGPHGGVDFGGALADLVRVPWADHLLLPLPEGLDPIVACGIPDNVSDGYRCVAEPLAKWPHAPTLVVGGLAPSVGLYAVAAAVALGADRVVYVDFDAARVEVARALGAEAHVVALADMDAFRFDERFPVTVDTNVFEQGRNLALRSTAPCGTCTSVSGGVGAHVAIPLGNLYLKGVTYEVGRVHARSTAPKVLDLVMRQQLDPGRLVTRTVSFDDAAEAMTSGELKVVFAP